MTKIVDNKLVRINLLSGGGYTGFDDVEDFPLTTYAFPDSYGYTVPLPELVRVGYNQSLQGAASSGEGLFFSPNEVEEISLETPNPELVRVEILNDGGHKELEYLPFPLKVHAKDLGYGLYSVTSTEIHRVSPVSLLPIGVGKGKDEVEFYFEGEEVHVSWKEEPSPRLRKKRIVPPVRVKSDVRITYNGGVGYTITNVKQIIISKDSDAAFITSIVKGIKTQVELPLSEINSIKLKTPSSTYDFHVEGAYPDVLVVNPKLGMTASAKYFSLNLED